MRWIYRVLINQGISKSKSDTKALTCISKERLHDPVRQFRQRFGEDMVMSVTERYGDSEPVPSYLLPTCADEAASIKPVEGNHEESHYP